MSINLRLPNITGLSEKEQISQIRTYLYQLVGELQFALNNAESNSDIVLLNQKRSNDTSNSSNVNTNSIFAALKPLIIKSADIVDAYYDKITKNLEGEYVAKSDFGTYKEKTTQTIEGNSTAIEQTFANVQTIDTDLKGVFNSVQTIDTKLSDEVSGIKQNIEDTAKGLTDSLKDTTENLSESIDNVSGALGSQIAALVNRVDAIMTVNAYIKSGQLYYNDEELPVYGLEVGQTNTVNGVETFKKFARFTADRLSFYDQNDTEVAFISDYKLFITNAEVSGSLILGQYKIDTSNGLAFKWVGGESLWQMKARSR